VVPNNCLFSDPDSNRRTEDNPSLKALTSQCSSRQNKCKNRNPVLITPFVLFDYRCWIREKEMHTPETKENKRNKK
jgi:hypothetical protein